MPELPEAETIVRGLRPGLEGREVTGIRILREDVLRTPAATLETRLPGRRIETVGRRGKNVVLSLGPNPSALRLVINLGMTGGVLLQDPEPTHPCLVLELDSVPGPAAAGPAAPRPGSMEPAGNGAPLPRRLWFDDARRFGQVELMDRTRWREWNGGMGPEPLSPTYTADRLHGGLLRSRSPLRSWLLDQRRVAGVGNIYASEALFGARLHPLLPANRVTPQGARRLHRSLRKVLRDAIRHRGTTLRDYRDSQGRAGENAGRLRVYGRTGAPCPRCGSEIERIVLSNRSAFLCPRCQPAPDR